MILVNDYVSVVANSTSTLLTQTSKSSCYCTGEGCVMLCADRLTWLTCTCDNERVQWPVRVSYMCSPLRYVVMKRSIVSCVICYVDTPSKVPWGLHYALHVLIIWQEAYDWCKFYCIYCHDRLYETLSIYHLHSFLHRSLTAFYSRKFTLHCRIAESLLCRT